MRFFRILSFDMTFDLRRLRQVLQMLCMVATCETSSAADDRITLNFVNADIESVVRAISQITDKNFLIDPRVKGTINVVSGKPVPRGLAYDILLSALRIQGFAVIENNGVTKIVPEAEAKTHASPTGRGSVNSRGDQVITQVFPIRFESAALLIPILKPLVPTNNAITASANNNALVITDYADNIRRLGKIIEALDVPQAEEPVVVTIRNAAATDLAHLLQKLFAPAAAGAPGAPPDNAHRLTIIPDARTNSLLLHSDNPGRVARAQKLIESLDQPLSNGNIRVIHLKNAEAVRVAQTLRAIVSGDAPQPTTMPSPGTTGASQPAPQVSSGKAPEGLVQGNFIQADPAINALIIAAPEAVYNNLRNIIDQLDQRRAQVHIEALIVELSAERASEFGIQWQHLTNASGSSAQVVGGTNFASGGRNIVGVLENAAKASATGTLGIAPGLNIGVISGTTGNIPNLSAMIRALETDSKANILSTPTIITLDNEEAKIVIGQNVAFITGSYAQTASAATATPFQTYERRDVGLTLRVKPQITEGGTVKIQVFQEASSLQTASISSPSGPVTNKRSIESTVLVDDGAILALGGLIDDNYGVGEDKVPFLGDVPLIGGLFRYETRKRNKTNLMVFLRPTIIRTATTSNTVSTDRYDRLLQSQRQFGEAASSWYREAPLPVLPARDRGLPTTGQ